MDRERIEPRGVPGDGDGEPGPVPNSGDPRPSHDQVIQDQDGRRTMAYSNQRTTRPNHG